MVVIFTYHKACKILVVGLLSIYLPMLSNILLDFVLIYGKALSVWFVKAIQA